MGVQFSFSKWLRSAMDEAGITQAALAEMTGITLSTICGYLHDRRFPSYQAMVCILEALDKDIQIISGGRSGGVEYPGENRPDHSPGE